MNEVEELQFSGRVRLAARRFNAGAPRKALALHGWLDNANSFEAMAAFWPEVEIVALDFAGHGRSEHLPTGSWYHFIDYLDDVIAALAALDWPRPILLGHSLGGAVATVFAGAAPQRLSRLLLIEALGPIPGHPETAVKALRQGLDERSRAAAKQKRLYSRREDAEHARLQATPMLPASVQTLLRRGLIEVDGGLTWASDPKLTVISPIRLQEPVIEQWIRAIEVPTCVLVADQPQPYFNPDVRLSRMPLLQHGERIELHGQHHLHIDTPEPVVQAFRGFLARHENDDGPTGGPSP